MTDNDTPAGMAQAEMQLMETVAEFYEAFHTWRRLAEEHLGISFDELLQASQTEKRLFDEWTGPGWLTKERCRDDLKCMQLYLDAYEESQRKVGEVLAEGAPEGFPELEDAGIAERGEAIVEYDLDDMIEVHVAVLAEELECF